MPAISSPIAVQHWSARDVPQTQRLDLYADTLAAAVTPTRVVRRADIPFDATVQALDLGAVSAIRITGSPHGLVRGPIEIARSGERHFRLIVNSLSPWMLKHRDALTLQAGDAVLLDSALGHTAELPATFDVLHLKLDEQWLSQWLPSPRVLVGRRMSVAGWGRVLAAFIGNLTPAGLASSPLPPKMVVDHIGSLLALTASELGGDVAAKPRQQSELACRIQECIRQRCTDPASGAAEVAAELKIPIPTLHRCLAANGQTFGATLMQARVDVATRMLASPLFRRLTLGEIGARAGFTDPSHFSRAVRRLRGRTPAQLRAG